MTISDKGLNLIKQFESMQTIAYPDPATGDEPWTIGYGTTIYPNGQMVKRGDVCTLAQAESYLRHDVDTFTQEVFDCVKVTLNQNQLDALVSLCYNIGPTNFKTSTLVKLCNAGKFIEAAEQFLRWNKAKGKVMKGLVLRREAERLLFIS